VVFVLFERYEEEKKRDDAMEGNGAGGVGVDICGVCGFRILVYGKVVWLLNGR